MIAMAQGKQLGPGDLSLTVRDEQGGPYTPSGISYSIFAEVNGVETLVSMPNQTPTSTSTGIYYISMTIPTLWNGRYKLVWYINRYPADPISTVYEDFQVVPFNPMTNSTEAMSVFLALRPGMDPKTAELAMNVRELLSDTNPDRNYHFRPPTSAKSVAGYTSRVGFIWEDTTIVRMIKLSIAQLNTFNPMTVFSYTIDSAPDAWLEAACLGAAAKCLSSEAARWAAEEFGYSLNGVSLDLNKSATYQNLGAAYAAEFATWAPQITANRPASVGLRQSRWLLG
jgi:hypothetical protein